MAESPKNKTNPMLDALADDLEAMLSDEQGSDADAVELLADDDAIERLLMAESLVADVEQPVTPATQLLDEQADDLLADADDFNDVVLDSNEMPEKADWGIDDAALLAAFEGDEADDASLVEPIETFDTPELQALERVEAVDDLVDAAPLAQSPVVTADEGMDAFAAALLADDDEAIDIDAVDFAPATEKAAPLTLDEDDLLADSAIDAVINAVESAPEPAVSAAAAPAAEAPVVLQAPAVDYSADIAELVAQITALKKHQQALKQELSDKAAKEQLTGFVEDIGHLQSEQKKARRAVEAANSRKPVAAYVASGLAGLALLAAIGLAFQGAITNTQIEEMAKMVVKMQQEAGGVPTNQAAEKEVIQKQLDELAVASGVSAGQIAELQKALQGQAAGAPADEVTKQLTAINNQTMQMGAAIEALQDKFNALEKGHAVTTAAKPEKKKPEPVAENWVVNLIAYKQDWYAQRKADEFAAKGVASKVVKADIKGESWYRLVVDGFTSQYDAANYAAKTKKTLNLDSVWLSRTKE